MSVGVAVVVVRVRVDVDVGVERVTVTVGVGFHSGHVCCVSEHPHARLPSRHTVQYVAHGDASAPAAVYTLSRPISSAQERDALIDWVRSRRVSCALPRNLTSTLCAANSSSGIAFRVRSSLTRTTSRRS